MRVYALCLNHLCLPRGATTEYDAEIKQLPWFIDFFCCVGSSPPEVFLWKYVLKDMQ